MLFYCDRSAHKSFCYSSMIGACVIMLFENGKSMSKALCYLRMVVGKEIASDVLLIALQIEPFCSTINNLQSEIHA